MNQFRIYKLENFWFGNGETLTIRVRNELHKVIKQLITTILLTITQSKYFNSLTWGNRLSSIIIIMVVLVDQRIILMNHDN